MTHKFRMEVLRDVYRYELSGACLLPNHFGEIQKLTEIPCAFDNDFSMMYNYTKIKLQSLSHIAIFAVLLIFPLVRLGVQENVLPAKLLKLRPTTQLFA